MNRKIVDSGVEWIGKIPQHWTTSKIKYIGQYVNGYAFKPEDWSDEGLPIIRIQDLTGSNANPNLYSGNLPQKYLVIKGDILVSWAATLDSFVWNRENGWLNQHIFKAIPNEELINKSYFFWLLKVAMENMNNDNKHGIMMQHVTLDVFNNFVVPLPPVCSQQKIADFLDRECSEIDALIGKTNLTIQEYRKLKQSVITYAVIEGVRGQREMKECKIEWIAQIPSDWDECRIKDVVYPKDKEIFETDEIVTCFRDGEVTLRRKRREDGFTVSFTEHGYHGVDVGNLVIHGMDAFAGAIGCSDSRGKTTPVVHVCDTVGNNRYFMYYLRSLAYGNILMDLSNGVRIRSSDYRNFAKLGVFGALLPPREEQDEIVAYLDQKCEEIDRLIAQKERFLSELENYKKSLIYEYVTGKKEVQ